MTKTVRVYFSEVAEVEEIIYYFLRLLMNI